MQRREFINKLGLGTVAGAGLLAGCRPTAESNVSTTQPQKTIHWKMVTTWPKNFPGLGTGAEFLAETINQLSGGRLQVKVYGAGELVPAFEIFDYVASGGAQMGHGGAYYWKGKNPALQFFASVPFGLTANEINAWLYYGGGMELWREAYQPFGLIPTAAGNTTVQMAGWFNKPINTVADLKGLKMRIPGLGGEVLQRLGGTPVSLPGSELFTALQTGAIDATEWVGPYNDLAIGLYQVAKYYYYPGWHEPGSVIECFINQNALNTLPDDLQQIVLNAARIASQNMQLEYLARNNIALQTLINQHQVEVRRLPDSVLQVLWQTSEQVVAEIAAQNELAKRIYQSYFAFRQQVISWQNISERAFLNIRSDHLST